jgi:hypothetical protein
MPSPKDFDHPPWKYQGNLPLETGEFSATQPEVNWVLTNNE